MGQARQYVSGDPLFVLDEGLRIVAWNAAASPRRRRFVRTSSGRRRVIRIDYDANAGLAARLGVKQAPAIVVVEAKRLRARLERPRGCTDINATLAPWLK